MAKCGSIKASYKKYTIRVRGYNKNLHKKTLKDAMMFFNDIVNEPDIF